MSCVTSDHLEFKCFYWKGNCRLELVSQFDLIHCQGWWGFGPNKGYSRSRAAAVFPQDLLRHGNKPGAFQLSKSINLLSQHSSRWRFRASLPWAVWWRSFQGSLRTQANLAQSCESQTPPCWLTPQLWNICRRDVDKCEARYKCDLQVIWQKIPLKITL